MKRGTFRPPPRRHPPIASGDKDYRGIEVCQRCGSTWDASVHYVREVGAEAKVIDARRLGERGE